jgi:cold shock CspA family protein
MIGAIKFYDQQKGFGFISPVGGDHADCYFRASALHPSMPIPLPGDQVEFRHVIDSQGRPIAKNVRPVGGSPLETVDAMRQLRASLDKALAGNVAANSPLASIRFALADLDEILRREAA